MGQRFQRLTRKRIPNPNPNLPAIVCLLSCPTGRIIYPDIDWFGTHRAVITFELNHLAFDKILINVSDTEVLLLQA